MKYFSEILNKNFDTEDECVKAEKEHAETEAKKAEAKALVKKDSDEVNKSFVIRNEARRSYNDKVKEAYKIYKEKVLAARKEYEESIEEVRKAKDKAELEFDKKYREFDKNHPEGYRLILKDGDDVLTVDQEKKYNSELFEAFDKFFDSFFRW